MVVDVDWRSDRGQWLEPFLAGLRIPRGGGCAALHCRLDRPGIGSGDYPIVFA